ncbi:hypothetical protein O3G_MSEX011662 [Manduca sexta]|uniref:Uncharacterized protein n=1 Tax=Manduca sexta TaxID=7130 RepID=A0A921ZLN6_MANSE|nr:hypothetical protein O3G_MSEX011662 [Manduca sexta]
MEKTILFTLFVPILTLDPKSVNLNLETSVLLEPNDAKGNTSILHNVRKFLDDLQNILNPTLEYRAQNDGSKFSDILDEIANILLNCSDEDIIHLSKELYKKVKDLKINDNDGFIVRNIKQNVKNTLRRWSENDPSEVKNCVRRYLQNEKGYFMDYLINKLNYFFTKDDIQDIKAKLNGVTKSNNYKELNDIVGNIVNDLFNYKTKESNLVDKDVIVAGRLKEMSSESSGKNEPKGSNGSKSDFKEASKEIILNKNIEVFVRAGD